MVLPRPCQLLIACGVPAVFAGLAGSTAASGIRGRAHRAAVGPAALPGAAHALSGPGGGAAAPGAAGAHLGSHASAAHAVGNRRRYRQAARAPAAGCPQGQQVAKRGAHAARWASPQPLSPPASRCIFHTLPLSLTLSYPLTRANTHGPPLQLLPTARRACGTWTLATACCCWRGMRGQSTTWRSPLVGLRAPPACCRHSAHPAVGWHTVGFASRARPRPPPQPAPTQPNPTRAATFVAGAHWRRRRWRLFSAAP